MSYAEYLALERGAATKHEYVQGRVYAMAGGTPEHGRLAARLARLIGNALVGRPCEVFNSAVRVRIRATGRATYPDLSVVCGRLERDGDDADALVNPVALFEVLSDSTEASDRGDKWAHYQRIDSLQEYVLISQREPRVEVFRREGAHWTYEDARAGQRVRLASVGSELAVDELFADALGAPASGA